MPIVVDMSNNAFFKEAYSKGLDAGMQKGIEKGQVQAAGKLLLMQLKARFGALPQSVTKKVKTADLDTLEQWSMRVLKARSLEKVFE